MRPIRSTLLLATVWAAVYAGFSFCVLGAELWIWVPHCGDGVIQEVYEYCGDGAVQDGEACDAGASNGVVCSATYGGGCTYCNSECQRAEVIGAKCGDWIVNDNEACDDANRVDADGCNNLCQVAFCGDNVVQAGESCDNGAANGAVCNPGSGSCTYCSASCDVKTLVWARCGDGKVDAGESCDDGNTNNNDACTNSCEVTFCGDSIVQEGESCDNGANNGTVCTPGAGSSCTYCSVTCSEASIRWAMCGDGTRDAGESCDDGNTRDGDGCSSSCIIEPTVLLDTWWGVPPVVVPQPANVINFGGEPVLLPSFLPSTGSEKVTYRRNELNK